MVIFRRAFRLRPATNKMLTRLLSDGLVEEVTAGGTLPVWRRDDDKGAFALRITARGLAAIGIETSSAPPEAAVASGATEVDDDQLAGAVSPAIPAPRKALTRRSAAAPRKGSEAEASRRQGSKQSLVIEMLLRREGSTSRRAGSRTRCAGSLRAWCARNSASRWCRRRPAPSGSTGSR